MQPGFILIMSVDVLIDADTVEAIRTPLAIRLIAAFNGFLLFVISLIAASVLFGPATFFSFTGLLALIIGYENIIQVLTLLGLPLMSPFSFLTIQSVVLLATGIIGLFITFSTISRKSWSVPLGIILSIICIIISVASYLLTTLNQSHLALYFVPFRTLITGFILNIFLTGVLLLWLFNELSSVHPSLSRFVLIWNLDAICLIWTIWLTPGIIVQALDLVDFFGMVYTLVAVISILNILVRPLFTQAIVQAARWPLGFVLPFCFIILVNASILFLVPFFIPGFLVLGLPMAFLGSLIFSAVNTVLIGIIDLDDTDSFFQSIVRRQLLAAAKKRGLPQTQGLVCIQIDGLSYTALEEALRHGYMPTFKSLLQSGRYKVLEWDCGLPSTTASCLAGIMHGNNDDIPGFSWYRKREHSVVVFNHPRDARFLEERHSSERGLLRGGSSIGNVFSGDASYSFFTMSTLTRQDARTSKHRREDLYYYLLHPYSLIRTLISTLWDIFVGLGQTFKWWITRQKPRMVQLPSRYPIVRAGTNVLLRDIVTSLVCHELLRGSPAIYTTYYGYDEIAHYAGPLTTDAFRALQGIDKQLHRILRVITQYAPRPYELYVLADHGQSVGWTFKQRYGQTLKDTIADLLKGKAQVSEMEARDAYHDYIGSLISEFSEIRPNLNLNGFDDRIVFPSTTFPQKVNGKKIHSEPVPSESVDGVIVCASGNLAHLYFTYKPSRVFLEDLEDKYPGFLANLIVHEGIGFIMVIDADEGPVLLHKEGAITLRTGQIKGTNPLLSYGRVPIRLQQLHRLAQFPSSGDIILFSPVYPDGSVAAYEELIGSHGGLGGHQTEPFLLHPSTLDVDGTQLINSDQIYTLLNKRRPP